MGDARIAKPASCHTFRHNFATHSLEASYDIRTVQEPLAHKDLPTAKVHTYALKRGDKRVRRRLDLMQGHGALAEWPLQLQRRRSCAKLLAGSSDGVVDPYHNVGFAARPRPRPRDSLDEAWWSTLRV